MTETKPRIEVIDALRGSALLGLLLVHSVEPWDFPRYPEHSPAWLAALDHQANTAAFFLYGGKASAIFALMFGVGFCANLERWSQRGINFRGRFLWRLGVPAFLHIPDLRHAHAQTA